MGDIRQMEWGLGAFHQALITVSWRVTIGATGTILETRIPCNHKSNDTYLNPYISL